MRFTGTGAQNRRRGAIALRTCDLYKQEDNRSAEPPVGESKRSPQQARKLVVSLNRFGCTDPDRRLEAIRCGLELVLAARQLGLRESASVGLRDLSDAMLRLALRCITDDSARDREGRIDLQSQRH
jgi:hypothetical protein